jgi:endonuclease/exonuclease/phosphatase family metal-dependent hydrolase
MTLRVMTYNIKGHGTLLRPAHIEGIAAVIAEEKPDIIGVQELHRGSWKARFHDQAAELERLTGLNLAFGKAMAKGSSEYGNAILTRGRIADAHIAPLPGSGEPRTVLAATVELDGVAIDTYVTHLAAWGRFGTKTRLAQAEAVANIAASSTRPFILTGDFNSNPTSAELRVFHSGDLVMSCFVDPIVTHRATRQCLDYIFVDPSWQIRQANVVRRGPSDHWPLVAELER